MEAAIVGCLASLNGLLIALAWRLRQSSNGAHENVQLLRDIKQQMKENHADLDALVVASQASTNALTILVDRSRNQ